MVIPSFFAPYSCFHCMRTVLEVCLIRFGEGKREHTELEKLISAIDVVNMHNAVRKILLYFVGYYALH